VASSDDTHPVYSSSKLACVSVALTLLLYI